MDAPNNADELFHRKAAPFTSYFYNTSFSIYGKECTHSAYTFDDMRTLHPRERYSFLVQE